MKNAILPQSTFCRILELEHKRAARSQRSFVLMVLKWAPQGRGLDRVVTALSHTIRTTDVIGWYETGSAIGVIFTEIGMSPAEASVERLSRKIAGAVREAMDGKQFEDVSAFYIYPKVFASESRVAIK